MAVDWITRNLYWVDREKVCKPIVLLICFKLKIVGHDENINDSIKVIIRLRLLHVLLYLKRYRIQHR